MLANMPKPEVHTELSPGSLVDAEVSPLAASIKVEAANSNFVTQPEKNERRLLIVFFAGCIVSMLAWNGALIWSFLWLVGLA